MARAKSPPLEPVPELLSTLALLQLVAGADMMAAAMPILRERMGLTPEKLAVMLLRLVNPDEVLEEREEQQLRGMSPKTLKAAKDRKELPRVLQGWATEPREGEE